MTKRIGRSNQSGIRCAVMLLESAALGLFVNAASADLNPERWRWSNPSPHGNHVMDMLATSDLAVQVGDAGSIHVQRLDERWTPVMTGYEEFLRSTCLLGSRILVTGEAGLMLWSDDGRQFSRATLSPSNELDWFEGVAASAQRAVAVGDFGSIYITTNGAAWTAASSGTIEWLRGATFGSGAFIAVGENGTLLKSNSSGTGWSPVASGTTEHLNRVRYLGKSGVAAFYAVGNGGTLLHSSDGAVWSAMNSGTTNHLYDVALNTYGLLVVGDQEIRMTTDDGASWLPQIQANSTDGAPAWTWLSAQGAADRWQVAGRSGLLIEGRCEPAGACNWQASPTNSSHAWLWDMTVQDGLHVAVGDLATIQTSLDGILWAGEVVPASRTNAVLLGTGGSSNLLIAAGNEGCLLTSRPGTVEVTVTNTTESGTVITNMEVSAFGVVWDEVLSFTTNTLQGVAGSGPLYLVSGAVGSLYASVDGSNWTARTTPVNTFLSGIAIGPGACVAVGEAGTLLRAGADGTGWTQVSVGTSAWLYRVRWLNDRFVVVGEAGTILTSPDGENWTVRNSGTDRWLTDVTYADGTWYASGYQGTLLQSPDLSVWTSVPLPTAKSLFTARAHEGRLLLAGVEGVLLRNRTAPDMNPVQVLDYRQSGTTDTNGVSSVYELFLFGGNPDQFFAFESTDDLTAGWSTNAVLELYDTSGTLYAIRTRDATNAPDAEFYRTEVMP